ncbi:MAG: nickel-responsive transcriptional regulator NikR [Chthoniobacterales bacterium]|nr:nickel-responsive transcriptional regulator NikR [Chthoniobacterales bacterium]
MKEQTAARFSVSLPPDLFRELDRMAHEKGYDNRSLAVADMVRDHLVEHRTRSGRGEIAGTITLVYDHHKPHVQESLTSLQHDHPGFIIATLHVHLDHDNCLEVLIARGKTIVAQYAEYEPLPGQHINGELTQGENIADIGGVRLAYMALQKALAKNPQTEKIDGFTPEQRFFLGYAQIWRTNIRDQELQLHLNTDPHSPGRYRTIGPLSNFDEFAKAFNIPADSKMMRAADKRVNIW